MYDQQKIDITILPPTSLADAANIAASRFYCGYQPIIVRHLWATITAAVATANATATFKYRPTPGSDTGAVTLGTLVLPLATGAAGKQFFKKLTSELKMVPGSELILSFTGGSGAGGIAAFGISAEPSWDAPGNNANMIASA